MKTRYPFKEVFLEDNVPFSIKSIWAGTDRLRHFELDNGFLVSILHSVFGWEAWASRNGEYITPLPVVFDNEYEALAYRDGIASRITMRGD